jgi:hypothetical protein
MGVRLRRTPVMIRERAVLEPVARLSTTSTLHEPFLESSASVEGRSKSTRHSPSVLSRYLMEGAPKGLDTVPPSLSAVSSATTPSSVLLGLLSFTPPFSSLTKSQINTPENSLPTLLLSSCFSSPASADAPPPFFFAISLSDCTWLVQRVHAAIHVRNVEGVKDSRAYHAKDVPLLTARGTPSPPGLEGGDEARVYTAEAKITRNKQGKSVCVA